MAAGGALEGLHRNSRAQLPHQQCANRLEHIISRACRLRPSCTSANLMLLLPFSIDKGVLRPMIPVNFIGPTSCECHAGKPHQLQILQHLPYQEYRATQMPSC